MIYELGIHCAIHVFITTMSPGCVHEYFSADVLCSFMHFLKDVFHTMPSTHRTEPCYTAPEYVRQYVPIKSVMLEDF